MSQVLKTIRNPSKGKYREKGSKFLAFAYPVIDENEVGQILWKLRKEYHDARHHCYAWMLGVEGNHFKANDGGEPGHSAGDPILGQIRSRELTNILVVVVRYFGGTKLGVGGLVNAYKSAAADALDHAEIVKFEPVVLFHVAYPYEQTKAVMRLINSLEIKILSQDFGNSCELHGEIKERFLAGFLNELENLIDVVFMGK